MSVSKGTRLINDFKRGTGGLSHTVGRTGLKQLLDLRRVYEAEVLQPQLRPVSRGMQANKPFGQLLHERSVFKIERWND
jgi:hypothetical protein